MNELQVGLEQGYGLSDQGLQKFCPRRRHKYQGQGQQYLIQFNHQYYSTLLLLLTTNNTIIKSTLIYVNDNNNYSNSNNKLTTNNIDNIILPHV